MTNETSAQRYRWTELEVDRPMEKLSRRRVIGEHVMLAEVHLEKGFRLATHQHPNEQIAVVQAGRLRFVIAEGRPDERELVVGAGEVLHLPPDVPHGAVALEDSVVLDVFSPVSETTGIDARS